jgi:hypothetical protein
MPSRSKEVTREVAKLPSIPKELVSLFLTGPMTGEAINAAGLALHPRPILRAYNRRSPAGRWVPVSARRGTLERAGRYCRLLLASRVRQLPPPRRLFLVILKML